MTAQGAVGGRMVVLALVLVGPGLFWPAPASARQGWSPQAETVASGDVADYEDTTAVALDADGNAVAVWRGAEPGMHLLASSYSASERVWSPAIVLSSLSSTSSAPDIVMDHLGNATVAWQESGIRVAHYSAATGTWLAPVQVIHFEPPYRCQLASHRMAADRAGHVLLVWTTGCSVAQWRTSSVRYARYTAATGAVEEGALAEVTTMRGFATADIAVDAAGNAVALWGESSDPVVMRAAYYTAAINAWSTPVTALIGPNGSTVIGPRIAIDAGGNVLAAWRLEGTHNAIRAARLDRATLSWGQVTDLSPASSLNIFAPPEVAVDRDGNGITIWKRREGDLVRLQAASYDAAGRTWGAALDVTPPGWTAGGEHVGFDAVGNATAVWWQGEGVRSMVRAARVSAQRDIALTDLVTLAQPATPLALGVSAGGNATVLWTDVSNGIATLRSTAWRAVAPEAPTSLAVTAQSGRVLTLRWLPATAGVPPTGYVLRGGTLPGEVLASIPTGSLLPTFTFTVPPGSYFLRVHAIADGLWSAPSNELRVFAALPVPPSAPAQLLASVNGTDVALSWKNTFAGGPPTGLVLSARGSANVSVPLPLGEMFSMRQVPPGTYTVALTATNGAGESPRSNMVTLTVPAACVEQPNAPEDFTATASGHTFDLAWSPPAAGAAVTSYTVTVSGTSAAVFTTSERTLSGTVASGTYTVRVQATNGCGAGPATAMRAVVIP